MMRRNHVALLVCGIVLLAVGGYLQPDASWSRLPVAATQNLAQQGAPCGAPDACGAVVSGELAARKRLREAFGKLPPTFVPNPGGADPTYQFQSQGPGYAMYFSPLEVVFVFYEQPSTRELLDGLFPINSSEEVCLDPNPQIRGMVLALRFLGANSDVEPKPRGATGATVNYFMGDDPTKWRTAFSTYREIVYPDLWPGIDLVFRGGDGQLKYEFILNTVVTAPVNNDGGVIEIPIHVISVEINAPVFVGDLTGKGKLDITNSVLNARLVVVNSLLDKMVKISNANVAANITILDASILAPVLISGTVTQGVQLVGVTVTSPQRFGQ